MFTSHIFGSLRLPVDACLQIATRVPGVSDGILNVITRASLSRGFTASTGLSMNWPAGTFGTATPVSNVVPWSLLRKIRIRSGTLAPDGCASAVTYTVPSASTSTARSPLDVSPLKLRLLVVDVPLKAHCAVLLASATLPVAEKKRFGSVGSCASAGSPLYMGLHCVGWFML